MNKMLQAKFVFGKTEHVMEFVVFFLVLITVFFSKLHILTL